MLMPSAARMDHRTGVAVFIMWVCLYVNFDLFWEIEKCNGYSGLKVWSVQQSGMNLTEFPQCDFGPKVISQNHALSSTAGYVWESQNNVFCDTSNTPYSFFACKQQQRISSLSCGTVQRKTATVRSMFGDHWHWFITTAYIKFQPFQFFSAKKVNEKVICPRATN